jgi:hypothetical protein
MKNHLRRVAAFVALGLGLSPTGVGAQTPEQPNDAGHATELGVSLGATVAPETTTMAGGTIGWRVSPWAVIQARGTWYAEKLQVEGIGADVGATLNLLPMRRATPYGGAGFGLYRATVTTSGDVPAFYRSRLTVTNMSSGSQETFTDPAWRFSGGVDVVLHRSIRIRPEATVILVHGKGTTRTITSLGVHLAYIFEDHPVTPATR